MTRPYPGAPWRHLRGDWTPASWRDKPAHQLPTYEDARALSDAEAKLREVPPLAPRNETRRLAQRLAQATRGEAFLLQGGDCAESFKEFDPRAARNLLRVFLQMALVLTFGARTRIVKVGRVAGQFAKPRSSDTETQGGVTLPSYRGDAVNGPEFTPDARRPDPERLLKAYWQSAATLNQLRGLVGSGEAALTNVRSWNEAYLASGPAAERFGSMVERIDEALAFMAACGIDLEGDEFARTEFYTSHEGLLLGAEEAQTWRDEATGEWFAASAHMLWIGDRTRQPDGAHVEYFRGIANPIGVKCGPSMAPSELLRLLDILDPDNKAGRITLIGRFGANAVGEKLPALMAATKREGREVLWVCDPMHGNTRKTGNGFKTRAFDDIMAEVQGFFDVAKSESVHPGGVHVEMTGRRVTECVGGVHGLSEADLSAQYDTHCDPRLNADQALELAFHIAEMIMDARRADISPRKLATIGNKS